MEGMGLETLITPNLGRQEVPSPISENVPTSQLSPPELLLHSLKWFPILLPDGEGGCHSSRRQNQAGTQAHLTPKPVQATSSPRPLPLWRRDWLLLGQWDRGNAGYLHNTRCPHLQKGTTLRGWLEG